LFGKRLDFPWNSFDFLFRIEPFQRVAPTPRRESFIGPFRREERAEKVVNDPRADEAASACRAARHWLSIVLVMTKIRITRFWIFSKRILKNLKSLLHHDT
jgi:hypothetical protein